MPNAEPTGGKTRRERRTLWLMLPEVGSLRLGYLSKVNDRNSNKNDRIHSRASSNSNSPRSARRHVRDDVSYATEDFTDGDRSSFSQTTDTTESSDMVSTDDTSVTFTTNQDGTSSVGGSTHGGLRSYKGTGSARRYSLRRVQLSSKYNVALTDVTCLTQEPKVNIRFSPDDATEHLRMISVIDMHGATLLFLANNFREAELLVCGLKLLLERETSRLGIRGGVPISQLEGKGGAVAKPSGPSSRFAHDRRSEYPITDPDEESVFTSLRETKSGTNQTAFRTDTVPEGQVSWSKISGRDFLQTHALESSYYGETESYATARSHVQGPGVNTSSPLTTPTSLGTEQIPTYTFSELIIREIASKVYLAFPLPLCRALLLDSSSPVITKWEAGRGDFNYCTSPWTFPPATPRENEKYTHEHQLIASGSMVSGNVL